MTRQQLTVAQSKVDQLQRMLTTYPNGSTSCSCINEEEARWIQARLTEKERRRVVFSWLTHLTPGGTVGEGSGEKRA